MNGPIDQRYLDLQQAAVYLGLSPKTLYEWVAKGNMPAYKLGRVWRFDIDELDQFVHQRRTCYNPSLSENAIGLGRKGH